MKLYTIYDRVTATYGVPFFAANLDDAKRRVAYSYKDNPFMLDMQLFVIGDFREIDGAFSVLGNKIDDYMFRSTFVLNVADLYGGECSDADAALDEVFPHE